MSALSEHQATELGKRIVNALRPTPPLVDWVPALTGLDHDRAWRIYEQAVQRCEDGLRVATFLRLYRDDVADERRRQQMLARPYCGWCQGTGYSPVSPVEAHDERVCRAEPGGDGCACTAVAPCRCTRPRDHLVPVPTPPSALDPPPAQEGTA